MTNALSRLMLVVENYPNLKADQSFLRLQDELAGTENRIAVARNDYTEAVNQYNAYIRQFPQVVTAKVTGRSRGNTSRPLPARPRRQRSTSRDRRHQRRRRRLNRSGTRCRGVLGLWGFRALDNCKGRRLKLTHGSTLETHGS
jgi:hypothetical protein